MDREKVIKALQTCSVQNDEGCQVCPYFEERKTYGHEWCTTSMAQDALAMLKEQDEEHRRLLSWLGKFCRHIDNGDKWLTDEENLAFFKEKMKQQFGWDTD